MFLKVFTNYKISKIPTKSAISLLETLLVIFILSILTLPFIKQYQSHILSIQLANKHIQMIQNRLINLGYESLLSKQNTQNLADEILKNSIVSNRFFTFKHSGKNKYLLQIGDKKTIFNLVLNPSGYYTLGCNPNQKLCRDIYHRKHAK